MSIPDRLYRVARRRMMEKLGLVQGTAFRRPLDIAEEELEAFLNQPDPPRASPPPRPDTSRPHPYTREYRILGAPVGAEFVVVQQCWRRIVRETHPDRFGHDPEEQRRACERLRRVNEAYDRLRAYLNEPR